MTTIAEPAFAAALGVNTRQLWSLRRNPQFPVPTFIDPAGQASQWQTTASGPFITAWGQALARGWKLHSLLALSPPANIAAMAAANPGSGYRGDPRNVDPLENLSAGFS